MKPEIRLAAHNAEPGSSYKNPIVCEEWSEAFDACRERDRPLMCQVGKEIGKCFPSGRYEEAL